MNLRLAVAILGWTTLSVSVSAAFAPIYTPKAQSEIRMLRDTSRRRFFETMLVGTAAATASVCVTPSVVPAAVAAESAQDIADKAKIAKGLQRLNYFIDNWDKETTVCKTSNDNPYIGCERTPIKVMEYLGYKSMDDPLFKADKTLRRLEALVPPEDQDAYIEAVDMWIERADEGSGMAYVSSWGESNPGGGKDRIAYFIERSKKDVVACRDSLATAARILRIE